MSSGASLEMRDRPSVCNRKRSMPGAATAITRAAMDNTRQGRPMAKSDSETRVRLINFGASGLERVAFLSRLSFCQAKVSLSLTSGCVKTVGHGQSGPRKARECRALQTLREVRGFGCRASVWSARHSRAFGLRRPTLLIAPLTSVTAVIDPVFRAF